jgi:23S rRNA pseudouridine2605 synthase
MTQNVTPLNRALSKLGLMSRSEAVRAIRAGRVRVNGRVERDPSATVVPERARIAIDGRAATGQTWRALLLHKPRGVVTSRRDADGRPTIYDVLGEAGRGLIPVGRLDLATSGLLLLTNDTRLADWVADPGSAVPRLYAVTVRGRVEVAEAERLTSGVSDRGERLAASAVTIRKASARESHLTVELREGRNREIRRLCAAVGHEVTRLKRVRLGGLDLGALEPGGWRELSPADVARAFPGAPSRRQPRAQSAVSSVIR